MHRILLISIFALGAFLRFCDIDKCCLYNDEVLTAGIISDSNSLKETWYNVSEGFYGDLPGYYVILKFWTYLTGESLFWLRVFSLVCGMLFILVLYKLAGLLFDRRTALLSAYFTAISPLLVFYSRVVRYYSLSSFLHLGSLYFFIKVIEKKDYRSCFFYALFTVAGLYVNYSSFLFLASQILFLIIYRRRYADGIKKWLLSMSIVFILWLPISWYFFRDFILLLRAEGFKHIPIIGGWISAVLYLFLTFSLGVTVSPFNYPIIVLAAIPYLLAMVRFLTNKQTNKQTNYVLIITVIFAIVFLCALSGYNSSRYIKAVCGLYVIVISVGILDFRGIAARTAFVLTITIVNIYSLRNLYAKEEYHHKESSDSWDEISEYVDSNSGNKDVIIFNSLVFGYYISQLNPVKSIHSMPEDNEGIRQLILENIEQPGAKRVILVDSPLSGLRMKDFEDEIGLLKEYLTGHNYALKVEECFDRDKRAALRRKLVNRPFPECRTKVYIYSKILQ